MSSMIPARADLCPICGLGELVELSRPEKLTYLHKSYVAELAHSVCTQCESEVVSPKQAKRNKQVVLAARKAVLGLLRGGEIRAIRKRFGLTQKDASTHFGGGPNAFSKYENDSVIQSDAMDRLLRLASATPHVVDSLVRISHLRAQVGVKWAGGSGIAHAHFLALWKDSHYSRRGPEHSGEEQLSKRMIKVFPVAEAPTVVRFVLEAALHCNDGQIGESSEIQPVAA